ncbi:mannitol dehydrogenase family protein [Notoacmeibacter sp. MSK16QG-6]|uniref:mannitol dehydrogenase family protein n=1 Tax=Notoacmeibacter sp. MSK16QG-6 TaxID=2957982 RepID=UPI00209CCF4B|nr:mannitol dehydrogenase family protein [Notoacmeibacter sp. MSK16QG-6]MCP1201060.1 mannitol dehydrogenase family protein [Notoacmeibacter sp. MSK16QG-6]
MTVNGPAKLSSENLSHLLSTVGRPSYDRSALSPGIVHIGVGNFHRAHQATFLHRLFEQGKDRDWAIIGAGTRPFDRQMRDKLVAQDFLSTIVELDPKGLTATVIGSMIDFCKNEPQSVVDAISDPRIRVVSLTVTEGGYYVDASTGGFDTKHPEIVRDASNLSSPSTVFGILIEGLSRRRKMGVAPFTVMSCDNLPENGHVAHQTVVGLARLADPDLADWIAANVAFPNSMVDCITPATGPRELALVRDRFGIIDEAAVVCEPFRQWVLEDKFPSGRPAFEDVGVQFVDDVAAYELMKLRILNGGHAAIAYPAALLGYTYVDEAIADPDISDWFGALQHREIMPTVRLAPGIDPEKYFWTIVRRFANPELGDTIPRLCMDGANRQPKFILPIVDARLKTGGTVSGLALEIALWCRYCAGETDDGQTIQLDPGDAAALSAPAIAAKTDPMAWLSIHGIFGDLGDLEDFSEPFAYWLATLNSKGTRCALREYAQSGRDKAPAGPKRPDAMKAARDE